MVDGSHQGRRRSSMLPPAVVVLLGLGVHLILTYSVIDIHFQTPVVRGIPPEPMHHPGPAKRVVVVVADGLRADKLFEPAPTGASRSPFLRGKALRSGRFGISHTRPPTESRPGHVAMLAGFYEDPSALFSGWQANPVEFDSVFNHTVASWGFGSPDVVPMFKGQGAYEFDAYEPELEDFGREDLAILDVWTFNRTRALLEDVRSDPQHPLRNGPAILFLHLLGIDSNAHAHGGPASEQYLHNIQLVDDNLAELVGELEALFEDGATAWLYTADHGMSDQASHGDGAPENTETPYVVWGAGVGRNARAAAAAGADWGYGSALRHDIEQAQLTPLVAALLGVPTPVNSIGLLPLDLLAGSPSFRAHAAWANARQLLAAHDKREEHVKATSLRYIPNAPLADMRDPTTAAIARGLMSGDFALAEVAAGELAGAALKGIEYLQRYDWAMLMATVTLGFLGWMAFLVLQIMLTATQISSAGQPAAAPGAMSAGLLAPARQAGALAAAVAFALLYRMQAPPTYYLYALLPTVFWSEVLHHKSLVAAVLRSALATPGQRVRVALELPAAAGLLVCMALGFKHREIYALLMMAAPLLVALTSEARRRPAAWRLVGSFATAGAFALAPTSKRLDNHLVVASGAGAALLVLLSTRERQGSKAAGSGKASAPQAQQQRVQALTLVQLCSVALALAVAAFAHKGSPQPVLRAIAWLVYLTGPLLPLLSPPGWRQRWRALLLGLLAPFILVSICWEPLFFGAMAAAVDAWLAFDAAARGADRSRATAAGAAANGAAAGMQNTASAERQQAQSPSTPVRAAAEQALPATPATGGPMTRAQARARAPQLTPLKPRQRQPPSLQPQPPPAPAAALEGAPVGWVDLHRVLLFLLLIQMGFFGQGNTATIASFDLASVYRLVTVFNPFVMTAILLGKIFIPQVLVAAGFAMLTKAAQRPRFIMYLLVLVLSDVMSIKLFFDVRSTGSWMEIGSSIGYYGILNAQVVFVLLLFVLVEGYVADARPEV